MKERIENVLRSIEQAFIEYFGRDYRGRIRKVFDELIIVGFSNDGNNGNKIDFISKDLKTTRYSDKDIEQLRQNINDFGEDHGFCWQYAPQSTIGIRTTDCELFQLSNLIHEITHALIVEELAEIENDNGQVIGIYKKISTALKSRKGEYTDEIIVEGITLEVIKIYNKLYSTDYKHTSGYIHADKTIESIGMKLFKLLEPAIKKYILTNPSAIRKIMGKENYLGYSDLLEKLIRHIQQSGCRTKKDYIKQNTEYVEKLIIEGSKIIESVTSRAADYERYETDIEEYVATMIENGKAIKLER